LATRLLETWCEGVGHGHVNLKRASPTRWSQLWDNVLKLGEALHARLDEFLVDYARTRAKDTGASKGVIACLIFDASEKRLVGQLRDVLKPVQSFNLLGQIDGLSLAEGFFGAVELFCELDSTRVKKTSLAGDWEVHAAMSTEEVTAFVNYAAADMDDRAIALREGIKGQILSRFLDYSALDDEYYVSIWFDPRVRAKLNAIANVTRLVKKLWFLGQGDEGILLLSGVRDILATRATPRLAETCGIEIEEPTTTSTPTAPVFHILSPDVLQAMDFVASTMYQQRLAAHVASSTSTTSTSPSSCPSAASLETHLSREIALFESLIVKPEYVDMSGSQFFAATRTRFPKQLMLLYSIFCSNRVLSPSNAKMESIFSQAARVTPSTRASTGAAKVNELMMIRMSPLITPEFALKVADALPSSGPVPVVAAEDLT